MHTSSDSNRSNHASGDGEVYPELFISIALTSVEKTRSKSGVSSTQEIDPPSEILDLNMLVIICSSIPLIICLLAFICILFKRHSFPINPEVKEKWILATGKKNWFPSKHSKICSAHFQEQDFNPTRKRRVLLDHAYPTIHVWTTSENVSDIQVNVTPSKSPSPSMSSKSIKRAIQLDPDIMETPRKRKMQRIINEKENVIKTQRSKIKCLQETSFQNYTESEDSDGTSKATVTIIEQRNII
ncbi:unnamed protein product [Parnassius apollo]|uniref:(apollo) hypothetical protein n=1 Tax=Parnassius apollo TaxID=110799 RepID=A0A8S3W7H6_PARAO|nr:unnamed protein product [Parnassius apollo]